MALSYDTLNNEAAWRAQTVPPALEGLGAGLRAHFGVGRDRIGSPGDNLHLRGGHRSRRWILLSAYCTNRTYTVTHPADRLGDEDWYAAIDIDPDDQAELIAMTRRLDAAVRAGLFPEISEWFGNLGGDSVVDGWNNITRRPATSSSSHLRHTHITFLRQHANNQPLMARLLAVLIGEDMTPKELLATPLSNGMTINNALVTLLARTPVDTVARLDRILAAAQDDGDVTVVLDPAALTELTEIRAAIAAVPAATVAEFAGELLDGATPATT